MDLAALHALRERQTWHRLATEHAESAETKIREYLGSYKLDAKARISLFAAGMNTREFDALTEAKQHLLSGELHLPPTDWLEEFSIRFQAVLDTIAERQAKSYGVRAAVGTALSPMPLLDQAVVLYSSLKLVHDLLVLYNLRPTPGRSVIVLARAILQTYLGGVAQDVTEGGHGSRLAGDRRNPGGTVRGIRRGSGGESDRQVRRGSRQRPLGLATRQTHHPLSCNPVRRAG